MHVDKQFVIVLEDTRHLLKKSTSELGCITMYPLSLITEIAQLVSHRHLFYSDVVYVHIYDTLFQVEIVA